MTVPANEYSPVTTQSALAFVDIPIPWPYGNVLTNLLILQVEVSTGEIRNSDQGGFTFTKVPDGTSITVERYSVFSDDVTYRVERHLPIEQTYDLTEQGNLSSSALEQALDDSVRISQDNFENVSGNIITSEDPYVVAGIATRRGHVLGYDKVLGEPVYVGDIDEIDDLTQALADANQASADATQAANDAEAAAASVPQFNSASVDPTVNDDTTLNYQANSFWVNTTTKNGFYCRDASAGAAIWSPVPNLSGYSSDNFHEEYQGDLDLISPNSTYYVDPAFVSNFPTELGTDFGFIQTLQQSVNSTVQVLYNMEVSKAWYRRKTSGSFSQWKKSMDLTDSEVVKNSFGKAFDPLVTSDETEGYAQGSQWVNQNTTDAFICADASTGAAVWLKITTEPFIPPPINDYILLQDQKPLGTSGGSFFNGDWRTRDLNTEVNDQGGHVTSLSSNRFTLAEGTYEVEGIYIVYQVGLTGIKLVRDPGGSPSDEFFGLGSWNNDNSDSMKAFISGLIVVGSGGETFEIQHRCSNTKTTDGFGRPHFFSIEIYGQVKLKKVL